MGLEGVAAFRRDVPGMRLPRRLLDVATIGLVFPVASALGFLAGRAIGGWFDAANAGALIGGLFGVVAGFYNVYQVVQRLNADEEDDESDGR